MVFLLRRFVWTALTNESGAVDRKGARPSFAGRTGDGVLMNGGATGSDLAATVLRVAWLSILLGLMMEGLLIVIAASFGQAQSVTQFVPDAVGQVSWSVFVCVGIGVGTAASKLRAPAMGMMGLLAAPLAFTTARVLHRVAGEAIGIAATAAQEPSLFLIAILKGVEYGSLGAIIGWVG
jgi:hypothetical protein